MRLLTGVCLLGSLFTSVVLHDAMAKDDSQDPLGELIERCKTDDCKKSDDLAEVTKPVRGRQSDIPDATWKAMQGVSWHRRLKCPARKRLALLHIPYLNFSEERKIGRLIVAHDVADDVLDVFAELYKRRFLIEQMQLVHRFGGNDDRSMAANNTSAFNCRLKTSGRSLSEHSYGRAIDINPVQNPYVRRKRVEPPAGRKFAWKRKKAQDGLIRNGDFVVKAFRKIGWSWGGYWRSSKDYQHFSQSGK